MKGGVVAIVCTVTLCVLVYLCWGLFETTLPAPPTEDIYVADFAHMVQGEDRAKMLAIGEDLDNRFGAQLAVVTIDTLGGDDIESYANRLFRAWGIGNAEKNNGVLLLIAKEDRKFRVEVGYGLEGAITDGYAGEVLDGMTPRFQAGEYSPGILEAYRKLAQKIYGEYGEVPPAALFPSKAAGPAVAAEEEEWTMEDYFYCGIFILLMLAIGAVIAFFGGYILDVVLLLLLGGVWYLLNVLLYLVSLGHWGTLSYSKCFRDTGSFLGTSGGSSGSSSGRSGGFGGGRSGGGGSSGGW